CSMCWRSVIGRCLPLQFAVSLRSTLERATSIGGYGPSKQRNQSVRAPFVMDLTRVVMRLLRDVRHAERSPETARRGRRRRSGAMNLLWIRPAEVEQAFRPDDRRVRDHADWRSGVSRSV